MRVEGAESWVECECRRRGREGQRRVRRGSPPTVEKIDDEGLPFQKFQFGSKFAFDSFPSTLRGRRAGESWRQCQEEAAKRS